jgi:hypothetical protein
MSLTKVSPVLIQVANNVTSTTLGNSTTSISLTFDESGVIIAASNNTIETGFNPFLLSGM